MLKYHSAQKKVFFFKTHIFRAQPDFYQDRSNNWAGNSQCKINIHIGLIIQNCYYNISSCDLAEDFACYYTAFLF